SFARLVIGASYPCPVTRPRVTVPAMLHGREAARQRVGTIRATGEALVLRGEHGSGRTVLLGEVTASGAPLGACAALLAEHETYGALESALRQPLVGDPAAVAATVVRALDGAALAVDDAQWADAASVEVLEQLVGQVPLVVTVASEEPGAAAVVDRLTAAGAEVIDLPP